MLLQSNVRDCYVWECILVTFAVLKTSLQHRRFNLVDRGLLEMK